MQTIWIQMKPHKMWGFIWDPNCLTFRLERVRVYLNSRVFLNTLDFQAIKYYSELDNTEIWNPKCSFPFPVDMVADTFNLSKIFPKNLIHNADFQEINKFRKLLLLRAKILTGLFFVWSVCIYEIWVVNTLFVVVLDLNTSRKQCICE